MCIRHTASPPAATTCSAPGRLSARTSLIIPAPSAATSRITRGELVSTEMTISTRAAIASTTGATRSSSCCSSTAVAPGRVDSPPTSTISAPCLRIAHALRSTRSRSGLLAQKRRPPSEKESGVILRMPMTAGRDRSSSRLPQRSTALAMCAGDRALMPILQCSPAGPPMVPPCASPSAISPLLPPCGAPGGRPPLSLQSAGGSGWRPAMI